MDFEWDEAKRAANLDKHGVDFTDAAVLDWARSIVVPQDHTKEMRFKTAAPIKGRLHIMIWTHRNGKIRVISLRKANARERRSYEQTFPDP